MSQKILEEELLFSTFEANDDILKLDCREFDNSDPLNVHRFIHENAIKLHKSKITTIYVVRYKNAIVACFTLSMFLIKTQRLTEEDRVKESPYDNYPAVLLGQMCVDKAFRDRGIGQHICKFSLGVASFVSKRVGCMCLVAHTNKEKENYYVEKCRFTKAKEEPSDGTVWLYRRVA